MNKTLLTSLIVGAFGLAVAFVGLVGLNFNIANANNKKYVTTQYEYDTDQIDNLYLILPYGELKVVEDSNIENVKVEVTTNREYECSLDDKSNTLKIGSNFKVTYNQWWNMFYNYGADIKVNISIPSALCLNELDIILSAGTIDLNSFSVSDLKIRVSAGELRLDNIVTDTCSIRNSAGRTVIRNGELKKTDLNVSAGEVILSKAKVDYLDFSLSAGDIDVEIIGNQSDYSIDIDVSAGSSTHKSQSGSTDKYIKGHVSAGSARFSFIN